MDDRTRRLAVYLHAQKLDVIGRRRHDALIEAFGDLESGLRAPAKELSRLSGFPARVVARITSDRPDLEDRARDLDQIIQAGITLKLLTDADYPAHLARCPDGPILLQSVGTLLPQDNLAIALVGSRDCSDYGQAMARDFGRELAGAGFTIVSGMARGIDSAAHRGALEAGGRTLAVQACGLDRIYPPSGRQLRRDIESSGAVLSEHPRGAPPLRHHFPRRNRIISGLSLAVLVVEARVRSGSLITARWAMEQDRDVYALPGRIDQPRAGGCHRLIQDGAKLVTCLEDILDEFPSLKRHEAPPTVLTLSDPQKTVIAGIKNGCDSTNEILEATHLDVGELNLVLFQLESLGCVEALAGKRWRIIDAAARVAADG